MAEYQIVTAADKCGGFASRRQLSDFLIREGQFLIPMVKLASLTPPAEEQFMGCRGGREI